MTETRIAHEALKLGIAVWAAVADERSDFIFDLHPKLVRVQCKTAACYGDYLVLRLYSARRTAHGLVRRRYSSDEIDAFAAYCPETDRCYYLDFAATQGQNEVRLRLAPPRNNQRERILWAKDFEFGATLGLAPGAIAQLGERDAGSVEVAGSSPAGSTRRREKLRG